MFKRLILRNQQNGNNPPPPALQEQGENEDEVQPVIPERNGIGNEIDPQDDLPRFELDAVESESAWNLPESQPTYLHKYMKMHVAHKEIQDHIMKQNPVPLNLKAVPELASYFEQF